MAHFAELDDNSIVVNVIVVANENCLDADGNESEQVGIDFLESLFGHRRWVQTSYNGNMRGVYAGIGFKYDAKKDQFVDVRPPEPEPVEPPVEDKLAAAGLSVDDLKAALGL